MTRTKDVRWHPFRASEDFLKKVRKKKNSHYTRINYNNSSKDTIDISD